MPIERSKSNKNISIFVLFHLNLKQTSNPWAAIRSKILDSTIGILKDWKCLELYLKEKQSNDVRWRYDDEYVNTVRLGKVKRRHGVQEGGEKFCMTHLVFFLKIIFIYSMIFNYTKKNISLKFCLR